MAINRPILRARNPGTARRCELVHGAASDTLYVYGVIGQDFWGDGISSEEFARAVRQSKAPRLDIRINSPGGDVHEGVAMAQALRDFKGELVAYVDGLAASAATFLTTAASKTLMAKGSMLMIHQAWTITMGNADDLLAQAALLEKIDGQIAQQYADRAGVTLDQAKAWMQAETWFTEAEAVEAKLADGLQGDKEPDADDAANARIREWDLRAFQHAPAALLEKTDDRNTITVRINIEGDPTDVLKNIAAQPPKTFPEYEQRCRTASLLEQDPA